MAVTVYEKARRSHVVRRVVRRLRGLLAGVLLTVAALTSMLAVVVPAVLLAGLGSADADSERLSQETQSTIGTAFLLAVAISLAGAVAGRRLAHRRRGLVLWLRRFRYGDATTVVASALAHISGAWRVVTLDDAATPPVGVAAGLRLTTRVLTAVGAALPRLGRFATRAARVVTTVCVAGIVVVVGWTLARDGLDGLFPILDGLTTDGPPDDLGPRLVWIFVVVLLAEFALLLAWLVILLAMLPFVGVFTLVGGVRRDVEAAEAAKSRTISTRADVEEVAAALTAESRRALGARLTVLRVRTEWWQDAVSALADRADAVLVDVSQVTDNVLWEIEQARARWHARTVVVGHRDLVGHLGAPGRDPASARPAPQDPASARPTPGEPAPAPPTPPEPAPATATGDLLRLRALLDGQDVLAYTTGVAGRFRFRRALFAELEETLPPVPWTWRRVVRAVVTLGALVGFALALVEAVDLVLAAL